MDFLLLLLTGFLAIDCSAIRQYQYVDKPLTWDEGKAYCRSNYLDLASIRSDEEHKRFVQDAGTPSRTGWIGLHHVATNWSWTMEDKHLYNYADGTFMKLNYMVLGYSSHCVSLNSGNMRHALCSEKLHFVCQNAEFKYFLVEIKKEWTRALEYCRRNYTDLANFRNDRDRFLLGGLAGLQAVWIGGHNRWRWADGSLLTLHIHKVTGFQKDSDPNKCVFVNESLYFVHDDCGNPKPFYCEKDEAKNELESKRLIVRIKIRSPYNFEENPAVHGVLLHQIHDELSKQNPEQNFTVTWKKQNGDVFQKKKEEKVGNKKQP